MSRPEIDFAEERAAKRAELAQQLGIPEHLLEVLAVNDGRFVVAEKIVSQAADRRRAFPPVPAIPGEELAITRDYLRQHQEKSLRTVLDGAIAARTLQTQVSYDAMFAMAHTAFPMSNRLPLDAPLIDRAAGDFAVLMNYYSHVIEHICKKINLPTHGGVSCGVVWDSSTGPSCKAVMTTSASIVAIPIATMMFCHF